MNEEQSGLTAARCYEIQTALDRHDVPEFNAITRIGMAAHLALHIRGLPPIDYGKPLKIPFPWFATVAKEISLGTN